MLFGGRYKLRTATVAVDCNRVAMQIPAEAVVQVTSHSTDGESLVEVAWEGRSYTIFAVDLMERGDVGNTAGQAALVMPREWPRLRMPRVMPSVRGRREAVAESSVTQGA